MLRRGEVMHMLDGKSAVVTGGAQGLGRAIAETLARYGASVVVGDVQADAGERTCAAIRDGGGQASFVLCDVTDPDSVAGLIGAAVDRHGRLDCAVNNAGIEGEVSLVADYPRDAWDRVIEINLKGVFLCMQEELRPMLSQGSGSIVNMASVCGAIGLREFSAYNASKHGVLGLTKTAAIEIATTGVRVNAVGPGFCETAMVTDRGVKAKPGSPEYKQIEAMHPMNRLGRPEEIGEAAAWLCSDRSSFITGQSVFVDGGYIAQ